MVSASGHDSNAPYADWMNSLKKPDFPLSPCCGPADEYDVREYGPSQRSGIAFTAKVISHDGRTEFQVDVPENKVIWDRVNPTGHGVIFIQTGDADQAVVCFVPAIGM